MEKQDILKKPFLIVFHGNFIPLQGVEYIVRAAKILIEYKDIKFKIIGKGQEWEKINSLVKELNVANIEFLGRIPYKNLPLRIAEADLCLGIFGDTAKTLRVIPNKVYECAAMGKPIITGDTPAIKELFHNEYDILLCDVADPNDLADKILKIKDDESLRLKISDRSYKLFKERVTPKEIAKNLITEINKYGF